MAETLVLEHFAPFVGQRFPLNLGESAPEPVELTLDEATPLKHGMPGGRAPFSLIWIGPLELFLPQGLYAFVHPALGGLEMHVVPVGKDTRGFVYQSVFN